MNESNEVRRLSFVYSFDLDPKRIIRWGTARAVVSGGVDPWTSRKRDFSAIARPCKDGTEFVPTSLPGMVLVGSMGETRR
jgi:hypothetical protein